VLTASTSSAALNGVVFQPAVSCLPTHAQISLTIANIQNDTVGGFDISFTSASTSYEGYEWGFANSQNVLSVATYTNTATIPNALTNPMTLTMRYDGTTANFYDNGVLQQTLPFTSSVGSLPCGLFGIWIQGNSFTQGPATATFSNFSYTPLS
jgi:hypothetical protein